LKDLLEFQDAKHRTCPAMTCMRQGFVRLFRFCTVFVFVFPPRYCVCLQILASKKVSKLLSTVDVVVVIDVFPQWCSSHGLNLQESGWFCAGYDRIGIVGVFSMDLVTLGEVTWWCELPLGYGEFLS